MAILTLTVNDPSADKRTAEVYLIARALTIAAQAIGSSGGLKTGSHNIISDGGTVVGTWDYEPVAAS